MTGSVTVYFNTGFNGIDIPASPTVLQTATKKTYADVYYMREDIDKPTIRIKDTYENLCAVDYCSITTAKGTSYYFAYPTAMTKGVTMLSLDLDALLTMGGAPNLNYISGWQERGHIAKADDVLFSNVASETWVPTKPLETSGTTKLTGQGSNPQITKDLDVVVSSIDLTELGNMALTQEVIQGIVEGDLDPKMYFPRLRMSQANSEYVIWDFSEGQAHRFGVPNTSAYDASVAGVKTGLEKLYSCGQLQLQSSYKIPKEYITGYNPPVDGYVQNIVGYYGTQNVNNIQYEYTIPNYTVKNKKCFATFRTVHLVGAASGDECVKAIYDLKDENSQATSLSVNVWADPCSTGKPYARFSYIKDSPMQIADCVRGLQWANNQLVMEGASGSVWNSMNTAFANQQLQRQISMNLFSNNVALDNTYFNALQTSYGYDRLGNEMVGLGIEGLGTAAGLNFAGNAYNIQGSNPNISAKDLASLTSNYSGAMSGAAQYAGRAATQMLNTDVSQQQIKLQLEQQKYNAEAGTARTEMANQSIQNTINQNSVGLIKNNNVVAPSVGFTPEQNLGLYGYNYFYVYETRKSEDDLKSEDMYYQRYGYNGLHRPLTAQCFKERQYYCYVQAFDVNLKGSREFGLRVRMKAISQLNAGVRVWKVLPDASYYETN